MKMVTTSYTVEDLVDLYRNGMLKANPEYQRGPVWSRPQQKKLIDSVLRGYPLPLIYLHHIEKTVAGMRREDLEIIDGQQRINALFEFTQGAYKLFDPTEDEREAKFPAFIKSQPCEWGRKDFESLPADLKSRLVNTQLAIVKITTDTANEARDLFIRLQSGLPLNAQETRDAWPGNFTDYILSLAGKPQLARYPGHEFFRRVMGMKSATDRGKVRQLAAQIAVLFLARRKSRDSSLPDINSKALNDFYYENIAFDASSPEARRLVEILDKLDQLLGNGRRPKLKGHDAIHLILLTDSLWDDYTRSWEENLPGAVDQFLSRFAAAKKERRAANPDEFWTQYGQWTRVNSDRGETIAHRHAFYVRKMHEYLAPLQTRDPRRAYGLLDRELIFFRDGKRCAVCRGAAAWDDADIHHVVEHTVGGATTLANGVLVHRACHPQGEAARLFAQQRSREALEEIAVS